MHFSKSIRDGTIVSKKGNKFIRASKRSKVFGVAKLGGESVYYDLDGRKIIIKYPTGICVYGRCTVLSGDNHAKTGT